MRAHLEDTLKHPRGAVEAKGVVHIQPHKPYNYMSIELERQTMEVWFKEDLKQQAAVS